MKILHINSYYCKSKFYKHLFENQVKNGLEILVYVPVAINITCDDFNYGNYTLISKNHGKYDRIIFHLKHKKIFDDIRLKVDIKTSDIIHAHSLFSNGYIAYKLNQLYNIPYIVAVRNTDINVFFKHMIHLRKLGIKILKSATKVIFLSTSYRDQLINNYVPLDIKNDILDKSIVIPNGIDNFWLKNIYKTNRTIKKDDIKIIFAGTVDKNKNPKATVKALNILLQNGINVKYTVIGRVIHKNIYEYLKKFPYVEYITQQPKEELIKFFRENDIFVMPSFTETFGLVYAEAMTQGLPIIYSKGQGFDNQFDEAIVGYHVDSNDIQQIAERIKDIIDNYSAISRNCINLCVKFDWDKISTQYINIYKELSV